MLAVQSWNKDMSEGDYENLSPLYMQRLKNRVEEAMWNAFDNSKYRQVGEYVARWHRDYNSFSENFTIFEKEDHIDLSRTLAEIPNEILIKMAADLGVETPGLLPCVPVMRNILRESNSNALSNFERAVKEVYEYPDESVALAASTLEGLIKAILRDLDSDASSKNYSLSKLTNRVVGEIIAAHDPSAPQEIKTLATHIRGLGSAIDDLRSDKSTAHGKGPEEYVVDDSLWAEAVVNATATLGILFWRLHERKLAESDDAVSAFVSDDDIPF